MAIAGGAKPSAQMQIVDGVLVTRRVALRQGVISDIDLIIHRLLNGETVYASTYGSIIEQVTRTIVATLARGGE